MMRHLSGITDEFYADEVEERIEREFFAQAHLHAGHLAPIRDGAEAWHERQAFMQHHGVPTRLLDWTSSPMVAAYFACVENFDRDGVIVVANPLEVTRRNRDLFGENTDAEAMMKRVKEVGPALTFFQPMYRSERQVTQQGHFSVVVGTLADHEIYLGQALRPGAGTGGQQLIAAKWILPARLKYEFLNQLRRLNVAGHSLFPGLDGLGRSLREMAAIEGEVGRRGAA